MPNATQESNIVIRDIKDTLELRSVEALQKEVWGCDDLDVVPLTLLVAGREVGATLIGAFDGATLVGFVYGFTGYENGRVTHHSHMLAVKPSYRSHKLGFKLKLAQRAQVLAQGIKLITWTFDPLQSLNAHLNFRKLGVISGTYKINFYGETTSSFLHQFGTDRLWVTWFIDTQRVRERLQTESDKNKPTVESRNAPALVQVSSGWEPMKDTGSEAFGKEHLSLEIPWNINELQRERPQLAVEWREATRWAFTEAFNHDYVLEDFYHATRNDQPVGVYLLTIKRDFER